MNNKVIIAIVAVVVLAAAGGGAAMLLKNGSNDGSDSNILSIDSSGSYSGGEYDKVIIGAGVGDGDVKLKGIKILKELIIRGGGSHSITMEDCDASGAKTTVEKEGGEAPRVNLVNSQVGEMDVTGQVIIEGDANSNIQTVNAAGADVTVQGDDTKVNEVKASDNASVTVTGGNVNKVDASGSTVSVTGGNASIDNLDLSGQSTVNVQNGAVDSMSMQQGSTVSLEVGEEGSIQTITYGDNVAVNTTGTNTETKLSEADQKMADGAQTSAVNINGQEQHIHSYTLFLGADWTTLDRTEKTVTATFVCELCDDSTENHIITKTVPVREYVQQPTCTEDGFTAYFTSFPGDNGSPRYDETDALGHDYEKTCTWVQEHSEAQVRFVCSHDSSHVVEFIDDNVQSQITEPTCEESGSAVYSVSGTKDGVEYEFTDVVEKPALGHEYGPDHVDWDTLDRTNLTVVVRAECGRDPTHVRETTVPVTERIVEATCENGGYTVYFTSIPGDNGSPWFDETDALGHDYTISYKWAEDFTSCTVKLACAHDRDHDTETTVNSTITESLEATCTAAGYVTYAVSGTFEGMAYSDTKRVDQAALGHDYTIAYQWSNDGTSCTVIYTCAHVQAHDHQIDADVTSKVLQEATCGHEGSVRYSVSGEYDGVNYADETTRTVPALDHTYGDVSFEWSDDHLTCTAVRTCSVCGDELTVTSQAQEEILVEPGIGTEGSARYTAEFNDYETQTITVTLPMLGGFTVTVFGGKVGLRGQEPTASVITVAENTVVTVSQPAAGFTHWTDDYGDYIPGESFDILVTCDLFVTAHFTNEPAYGDWIHESEPTCTEDGRWYRESGEMREYRTLPALGHVSDNNLVTDTAPTCTADGEGHTVCERCHANIVESIPATGHHYEFEVETEAHGSVVGQMEGICSECGDIIHRDYISPIYPSGDMVLRFDWKHENSVDSSDRSEVHTTWKVVDAGGVERQAYLFQIQKYIHKNGYTPNMDVTSWFFWIDCGEHSPVYVARHNQTVPVYGGSNNSVSWAVAGYADDLSEFVYLIDNMSVEVTIGGQEMHLGLGMDNGHNASGLYDMYNAWANEYNRGMSGLYESYQETYLGWNCTVYHNDDQWFFVNEDNCCVKWFRSNVISNREYGDMLRVVSITADFTKPFTADYWNSNDFPQFSAPYFNNMPTLENSTYFCIKLINGNYNSGDFTMSNSNRVNYFNGDDRDLVMWIEPNLPTHYRLDAIQVLDRNGTWTNVPYVKVSSHYEFDIQDRTVVGLYRYMMDTYPDRFVLPNDPGFNGVFIRCVTSLIPPDSTVTIVGGTFSDYEDNRVSTGQAYGGGNIALFFDSISGKELTGISVRVGNGEAQTLDSYYSYTVPENSSVTITPIYKDREDNPVQIDFDCTAGGTVDDVSGLYYEMDEIICLATPGYGFVFIGWYDVTDGSGPSEDNRMYYGPELYVYVTAEASFLAVFAPIDGAFLEEECTKVLATDGFVHWADTPVYLSALYGDHSESDRRMLVHADPNLPDVHRWDVVVNLTKNDSGELVGGDAYDPQFPSDPYFYDEVKYAGQYTTVDAVFESEVTYYDVEVYDREQRILSDRVAGDREFVTPDAPVRDGYDFVGWNTAEDGSSDITYEAGDSIALSGNLTLYAKWEAKTCITFANVEAPFFSFPSGSGITVTYGETATVPAGFATATGATITGWYYTLNGQRIEIAADGTGTIPYGIDGIYAILEYKQYMFTFSKGADDATGTMENITFTLEDLSNEISYYSYKFNTDYITFARTGYNLSKWKFDTAELGNSYSNVRINAKTLNLADNNDGRIDLTAVWVGKEYYVKYSRGDIGNETFLGTLSSSTFIVKADAPLVLNKGTAFSCSNLVLVGWNTAIDGTGNQYAPGETVGLDFIGANYHGSTTTITLYALWARQYYGVTFHGPENAVYSTASNYFPYATDKALPAVSTMGDGFTVEGYTFLFWTDAPDSVNDTHYTDGQVVSKLTRTGSIDLYGVWAPDTYTVVFDANNGVGTMDDQTFTVNVPDNLTANTYTKDGYHFEHWCIADYNQGPTFENGEEVTNLCLYGGLDDCKLASSVTIYAIWFED